jgi:hypothetical protein
MCNKRSNKEIRGTVTLFSGTNVRLTQKNFFRIRHCKYIVEEWEAFYGAKFQDYYYQVAFHTDTTTEDQMDKLIDAVIERKKQQKDFVFNAEVLSLNHKSLFPSNF